MNFNSVNSIIAALFFCFCFKATAKSSNDIIAFKAATFNLQNFQETSFIASDVNKQEVKDEYLLTRTLNLMNFDILALQEIRNKENFKLFFRENFKDYALVFSNCGGAGKQFLATAYKKTVFRLIKSEEINQIKTKSCNQGVRSGLLLSLVFKKNKKRKLNVVNLHLKAGASKKDEDRRKVQYKELIQLHQKRFKNTPTIFLGDLNSAKELDFKSNLNPRLRSKKPILQFSESIGHKQNYTKSIEEQLENHCSAYFAPKVKGKTIKTLVPSKLDHIIPNPSFLKTWALDREQEFGQCYYHRCKPVSVNTIKEHYFKLSDHCPVVKTYKLH